MEVTRGHRLMKRWPLPHWCGGLAGHAARLSPTLLLQLSTPSNREAEESYGFCRRPCV